MNELLITAFRLFNPWLALWEHEPIEDVSFLIAPQRQRRSAYNLELSLLGESYNPGAPAREDCSTCFREARLTPTPAGPLCPECYNGYLQTCLPMGGGMECDCGPKRCALMEYTPDD